MQVNNDTGISRNLIEQIISIINLNNNVNRILLFGSRARGNYKKISDIDLAIESMEISSSDINNIKNSLDELPTPLKFDVVNLNNVKKEIFKNNILNEGIVLYDKRLSQ